MSPARPAAAPTQSSDAAWQLAGLVRIAHHIPGRIRLKLAEGAAAPAALGDVQRFVRAATAVPGIRGVTLNPLARSCVVEYDPAVFPPSAWQDLLAGTASAAADTLLRALAGDG